MCDAVVWCFFAFAHTAVLLAAAVAAAAVPLSTLLLSLSLCIQKPTAAKLFHRQIIHRFSACLAIDISGAYRSRSLLKTRRLALFWLFNWSEFWPYDKYSKAKLKYTRIEFIGIFSFLFLFFIWCIHQYLFLILVAKKEDNTYSIYCIKKVYKVIPKIKRQLKMTIGEWHSLHDDAFVNK